MSSANKDYILRFGGEDATGPAFDEIIARAKAAGAKISTHLSGKDSNKPEWMEKLKDQFGRESAFGGIGEILKGGGAIIGITAAAEAIKGLAEGAEKVKKDFFDSDKNAADMAQDLMQSIPVLGNIEQAGAAINELFTGQQEALKQVKDDAAQLDKELAVHKQLIKEGADYYRDIEETIKRIKSHTAEIGVPPFQAQQDETRESGNEKNQSSAQKATEEVKKLTDDAKPAIDTLKAQIREQQNRIAQGFKAVTVDPETGTAIPGGEDEDAKREAMTQLAKLEARKGNLERNRDHQINLVQSGAKDEQSANDAQTKKQLAQQQIEHDRQMNDDARQSAIDHQSDLASHVAAELQLQGKFLDANIAQIHAGADRELAEQRLAADKKEEVLIKGSKEWLAIEADTAQKSADIQQQARDKEAQARKADLQWELEEAKKHGEEIAGEQDDLRGRILNAMGRTYQAGREELEKDHKQRMEKIRDDAANEIAAHGEHKSEIEKRAIESAGEEDRRFKAETLIQQIDAMKSTPEIAMSASAMGGVGLDSSALTGLAAPGAFKLSAELAHGNQVAAMQQKLGGMLPSDSSSNVMKINDSNIIAAINAVLEHLKVDSTIQVHFGP